MWCSKTGFFKIAHACVRSSCQSTFTVNMLIARGYYPCQPTGGAPLRFEKLILRRTRFLKKIGRNLQKSDPEWDQNHPTRDWFSYFGVKFWQSSRVGWVTQSEDVCNCCLMQSTSKNIFTKRPIRLSRMKKFVHMGPST